MNLYLSFEYSDKEMICFYLWFLFKREVSFVVNVLLGLIKIGVLRILRREELNKLILVKGLFFIMISY